MFPTRPVLHARHGRPAGLIALAVALAISLCARGSHAADWDELRSRMLSQYHFRLHWNNVSGPPVWTGGVPIQKSVLPGLSTVTLVPGESVQLLVPADSFVRVYRSRGLLASDDLQFWISDGSGLKVRRAGFLSPDRKSLVAFPDHPETALVRICRPESCLTPVTVALFVSYQEDPGEPISYRTLACTPSAMVAIKSEGKESLQRFNQVAPARPLSVRVVGPVRLKLQTYLRYPPHESETRQSYQLRVFTGGRLLKMVDCQTTVETDREVLVENLPATLGRRETAYVEIPPGPHELTIDTTAPLLIRVLERDRPQYLFPPNRPPLSAERAESWGYLFKDRVSHWNLSPADFTAATGGLPESDGMALLAFRSARDNSRPQGPLRAYLLLRAVAAFRSDDTDLRALAEQIRGRNTYFRDLIPVQSGAPPDQQLCYFVLRNLRPHNQPDRDVIVAEQHVDEFASRLPSAKFTRISNRPEQAGVYRLPAGLEGTVLQVLVDQGSIRGSAPLFIQFDGGRPITLMATGGPELPPWRYSPGPVEAGLSAYEERQRPFSAGTVGGPFTRLRSAGRMISAGRAELAVPAGVSEIRVWSAAPQAAAPSVALRYLASSEFRLTEMEYIETARRAGVAQSGPSLFVAALQQQGFVSQDPYAERELRNHWHSLLAWLRQEDELFRRGLVPEQPAIEGPFIPGGKTSSQPNRSVSDLLETARKHADSEQWLPALEAWSQALPGASGAARKEAMFGRITALRHLGEDFLHETGLRGLLLFDPEKSVRNEAASRLARLYRRTGNDHALLRLYAVRASAEPSAARLLALAQQLADHGRLDDALAVTLVLPRHEPVTRLVLRTAYSERWWHHFEQALTQLSDSREQHLWRAWRCLADGNVPAARTHLQLAGRRGKDLLARLQVGSRIHTQLQQANPVVRAQAVFDWERWSEDSPSARIWSDAGSLVSDYDSSALLHNPVRKTESQYYIARRQHPVTFVVQGPARFRIAARPLHPAGESQPIDDWMIVQTGERRLQVPITHNHAADTVHFIDRPEFRPGLRIAEEFELGPGRHRIRVFGESVPLAVRLELQKPQRPLCVLPPIEPVTIAAALCGPLGKMFSDPSTARYVRMASPANPAGTRMPIRSPAPRSAACVLIPNLLPAEIAPRVLLRLGRLQSHSFKPITIPADCSHREQYAILRRLGLPTADVLQELPPSVRETALWRQGRGTEAVEVSLDSLDITAVRRRLSSYLWLRDHDADRREKWVAFGEYHFRNHAHLPGLRDIHSRLAFQSEWSLISQIERSAGLRTVPTDGWQPESPFLRIRKSLIGPLAPEEQVITGDQQLVLRLDNDRAARLECTVRLSEPPFIQPAPLTFAWQLDAGQEHRQQLTPTRDRFTFSIEVPEGEHTIRIRCVDPWVNQFLRVHFAEENGGRQTAVKRDLERIWNVATADEPLSVPVEGPALIRIEELQNGTITNELRLMPEGLQRLELTPSAGQTESLYRVFQLRDASDRRPPRIKHREYPQQPSPGPYLAGIVVREPLFSPIPGNRFIPETVTPVGPPFASGQPEFSGFGASTWMEVNQEEELLMEAIGIWSVGAGYYSRRPLLEGIDGGTRPDKFLQVNLTRHRRIAERHTWLETNFLFRERVRGGETLGATQTVKHDLVGSPWTLYLNGSGYLQYIDEAKGDNWEGSLDLRARAARLYELGPKASHTPQVTLFGRFLSLDFDPFLSGFVDQDVFTTFKRDQNTGLILADRISLRPWLDTHWWIRPALMTNNDFNVFKPDNLSVTLGWEQWMRPVGLDLSYRVTGYFHDDDRENANTQHLVTLEGFTEGWVCGEVRCETSLFLQHELNDGDSSLAFAVTLTRDAGFNDWHYRPGQKDFQSLRKWRGSERRVRPPLDWW